MITKLFFICALAMACVAFTSCEKGDNTTGSTQIEIPGLGGEYDEARLVKTYYGETDVKGLYATHFYFEMTSSENSSRGLNITVYMFHNSPSFTAGTYTFPSTGSGTAMGQVYEYTHGASDSGLDGYAISGSVAVAISGDQYTVTFHNVAMRMGWDSDRVESMSFVYKGTVEDNGTFDGEGGTPNPEYAGRSTIEETIGGTTFPYVDMGMSYSGVFEGAHFTSMNLRALVGQTPWDISFQLFGDSRDVTGTYVDMATAGGMKPGTFGGGVQVGYGNSARIVGLGSGGNVTIAESNGIYTVTLEDIVGFGQDGGEEPAITFDGTYTGIRSYFFDSTQQ